MGRLDERPSQAMGYAAGFFGAHHPPVLTSGRAFDRIESASPIMLGHVR
jgi:hypothetical protein